MKFYLAGPVGYGNPGIEWKEGIKSYLRGRGHEVWDPIENDANYPFVELMNQMKINPKKHYKKIKKIMQGLFMEDIEFITKCDYLICYFVNRSYGTISEQGIAYYSNKFLGKKVKTICVFDETFMPDEWVLCCCDYVFFNLKNMESFIMEEITK